MRNGFSFLRSYYEAAQELPAEEQAAFFMAVCQYALDGEEPEITGVAAALFKLAKPNIDASNKKADAGKTGGSRKQTVSKTEANCKQTSSKTEANDKQTASKPQANSKQNAESDEKTVSDIGYRINDIGDRSKDIGEKEKDKKEKPVRHKYGEYKNVLLSDQDLEKLQSEFPFDWQQRIENVSAYCASHGKTYNDYLATIRSWARKDAKPNTAQENYNKVLDILGVEDG